MNRGKWHVATSAEFRALLSHLEIKTVLIKCGKTIQRRWTAVEKDEAQTLFMEYIALQTLPLKMAN